MSQEIVLQGLRGAKLIDGENVGVHIVQDDPNVYILLLGVVVGLETACPATVVVAVFKQIVLHDGNGVLCKGKGRNRRGKYEKE